MNCLGMELSCRLDTARIGRQIYSSLDISEEV